MVKYIALLTMTVDHATAMFTKEALLGYIGRSIGRVAFPSFLALIIYNSFYRTRNFERYLTRLFLWGIVSQPVFIFALDKEIWRLNAILELALLALIAKESVFLFLSDLSKKKIPLWEKVEKAINISAISAIVWLFGDYGAPAVATSISMSIFYVLKYNLKRKDASFYLWGSLLFLSIVALNDPIFFPSAVISFMIVANIGELESVIESKRGGALKKHFFYAYYPLHLAILKAISKAL